MSAELIAIISTLAVSILDLAATVYAMTMAGSCRSRCCMGGAACGCCDMAHEEKDDKLDVTM